MITSMIPNVENVFKNHHITNLTFLSAYKPYINYSWSQTLTVGGNQQIKDTGTSGLNLQQYFGQGCWFNGIDQGISTDVKVSGASWSFALRYRAGRVLTESALSQFIANNTGRFRIKTDDNGTRFNVQLGSYQINALLDTTAQSRDIYISYIGTILSLYSDGSFIKSVDTLTPQVISVTNIEIGKSKVYCFNGIVKDVYAFNRVLTQTEIEKYTNQPNQFFMDSLEDSSCVLAMPMCEKNNLARNYKNNTDYPINNYLTTCRTNAQRLSYGLQTSGFKRDSNGLILGKSNFLECDGVGIATRIGHSETVKIKTTVNPSLLSGTVLSGGISLSTTGMIINQDNIITLENQNPTTVVTFGNGFSGTIKEYKEEK